MPGDQFLSDQASRACACGDDPRKPSRQFTSKELQQLNEPHNAHVAVRGKVYDVSSFVVRHPGGMEQIMMGAGRDITQVFESYHPSTAHKVLDKFYVGELVDNELPVFPKQSKFNQVLKQRVAKYFQENNIDPKINYWMFLRYIIIFLATMFCWVSVMVVYESWVLLLFASVGLGFFNALIILTFIHDASHYALTHKPWVWKVVGYAHDLHNGASLLVWRYQHILGHHLYTNIDGADPDIVTSSNDIRRIKWSQKWLPRYFNQHIYLPALYCIIAMKTKLQDFYILFSLKNGKIRLNRPFLNQWIIMFLGKILYCIRCFVIPAYFMPWPQLVVAFVVSELCLGYWLALTFQASHVVSEVEWPRPDKDNVIHMDWAEMQVATTQDYATDSWFWTVFTGALNHQTTHHLFPGINQFHYPKIQPIVEQTCREFGLKYHSVKTAREGLYCHIEHLKKLGQVPELNSDKKLQ